MFVFYLTRSKAASRETSARSLVFCRAIEIFRDRDSTGTTGKLTLSRSPPVSDCCISRVLGGTGVFTHSDETGPVWRGDDLMYLWSVPAGGLYLFPKFVLPQVQPGQQERPSAGRVVRDHGQGGGQAGQREPHQHLGLLRQSRVSWTLLPHKYLLWKHQSSSLVLHVNFIADTRSWTRDTPRVWSSRGRVRVRGRCRFRLRSEASPPLKGKLILSMF